MFNLQAGLLVLEEQNVLQTNFLQVVNVYYLA